MTRMSIEVEGLDRLGRKLDHALDPVRDLVVELTEYADAETRRGAKPHAGDLGRLGQGNNIRKSVSPAGTPTRDLEGKVYTNSPIVVAVDQGRPPSSGLVGLMPSVKALTRWAGRHGIPKERGFYIARAIGRRGSKPVEFFQHALDATDEAADHASGQTAREIERKWGA